MTHYTRLLSGVLAASFLAGSIGIQTLQPANAQFQVKAYVTQSAAPVRSAFQLFQIGKWEDAEKSYMSYLKAYPNDSKARAGLAIVQAELLKLGAAEKNALESMRQNPNNSYSHVALGIVYRNQTTSSDMTYRGRTQELLSKAADEFKTAASMDPNNPEAHNRLGEIYRMQGNLESADSEFQRAVTIDPNYSEAVANEGTIFRARGDMGRAKERYRRAIALNSKNNLAHYYLGEALVAEGQYHDGIQSLNTALYQNRNSAPVHSKMAEAFAKQGNEAAAIAHYREAIQIKPEYIPAYRQLATLFDNRGDGEFAIAELKSALNANPNFSDFKLDVARLSLSVDKVDQAISYYKEVIRDDPGNADALRGLSQAYFVKASSSANDGTIGGSDDYVDAERTIQNALRANPDDISLHLALLRIAKLSGRPEMAQDELKQIVNSPAPTLNDQIAKAEAFFALGRYPESDQMTRQLLNSNMGNIKNKLVLGDAMKANGNLDMAIEIYKNVAAQDPDNRKAERGIQRVKITQQEATKKLTLAQSLDNYKQRKSAKDFYLESISMYPRQPEARLAMGKIYSNEKDYEKAIFEYESYLNLVPNLDSRERERIQDKIEALKEARGRSRRY
ncbi:MAG: tetratricopeptide repeat protein [Cyanobacteria bacterium]|nr:tetratricopeptide repeat protein [Cyanobacteriota bacterium]